MGDFVFTELRLIEGIDTVQFRELFGRSFEDVFGKILVSENMLPYLEIRRSGSGDIERLALSRKGLDNTNPVMQRFIETLYE